MRASPEQDDLRVRPPLCGNETPSAFPSTWNVFTVGLLPGTYGLNLAAFQRAIKTENCTTSRYPSLPTAVSLRKCQGFTRHLCVQSQLQGTEQGVGETSAWPPFTASPQWDLLLCQRGEMNMAGLKLGEPPRKFLKSKHHTGQTKAPNADCSPLFTVVIHNKILFPTICASLSHWNEKEKKCGESVDVTLTPPISICP